MARSILSTSELLRQCETLVQPEYADFPSLATLRSHGRDVYIVSDLHLAAGEAGDGTYTGTENFFADQSFARFLRRARQSTKTRKAILIINGDFIDFLRIVRNPETPTEFDTWQRSLQSIGIDKTIQELQRSISAKEKVYGLKTDDYKSVWKIDAAIEGHPAFFDGLAKWLHKGHSLIVVKGNHDLEWHWLAVRNMLRLRLAERVSRISGGASPAAALARIVIPNVRFIGHALLIDESVYIEHGHMYDKFSHVVGSPTLARNHHELNIPFGSFFNRYLINKVELDFPFFDNVRPQTNLLPMLFRERFFLGLKVLFVHFPFLLRIIPKGYYEYMFRRAFFFALAVGVPGILVLWQAWNIVSGTVAQFAGSGPASPILQFLQSQAANALMGLLGAGLAYGLTRLTAWLQLDEPGSLNPFAQECLRQHPAYRVATFGHTHNPDQLMQQSTDGNHAQWFYNTGTWIPVIEMSTAEVREDRMFIFLHLPNEGGVLSPNHLQRWNDDAERADPLVIIEPKDAS